VTRRRKTRPLENDFTTVVEQAGLRDMGGMYRVEPNPMGAYGEQCWWKARVSVRMRLKLKIKNGCGRIPKDRKDGNSSYS